MDESWDGFCDWYRCKMTARACERNRQTERAGCLGCRGLSPLPDMPLANNGRVKQAGPARRASSKGGRHIVLRYSEETKDLFRILRKAARAENRPAASLAIEVLEVYLKAERGEA